MKESKEKAVEIYTKFFLKDRVLPFKQRMKKSKELAIAYTDKKIIENLDFDEVVDYWEIIKKYIQNINNGI